ncbi:phospholipase A1 PLIP2, chloroplastic-like [Andrographis paniculata]|uniref:phospholipase A1 PLIP2, chloroplastic-like n=1 Tax=Andrographis paniculata TaxID=175694 RepID=UPI0021E8BFD9|nr:phospholipase A1 PLIP2, chloroplastic-like [Andrographis paniculata]
MDALCFKAALAPNIAREFRLAGKASPQLHLHLHRRNLRFRRPVRALWRRGGGNRKESLPVLVEEKEAAIGDTDDYEKGRQRGNWVYKVLHVNSLWKSTNNDEMKSNLEAEADSDNPNRNEEEEDEEDDDCEVCVTDVDEFNSSSSESFCKLLRKVPLAEARLYARMSYLGKLAYSIPQIKPGNLLRFHGLRLVTSSMEKQNASNVGSIEEEQTHHPNANSAASDAYKIAASYLQSHAPTILRFRTPSPQQNDLDSMTAVVAANEQVKQAVADDLNSTHSSPCEWFVCDDDQTATRFFVIQGSDSLASWQANLLFEPVQFEGMDDVLVHRGVYEAAKGIYDQMLPEIKAHLECHRNHARFYFTGHSLGGSLSLLVNLMLLLREQVPRSSLLPVIIFGAPSIMCGGERLMRKLGLPRNHVRSITLHRDIVPRAFSCNYPDHVAKFLKAINSNFRSLPCLKKQKLLYTPMGEFLILQPDHRFSPSHHLLPPGSGLYLLTCDDESDIAKAEKQIKAAQNAFLNSPHPLEILSDRSAYGSGGTIVRDHDMNSYLKSIRYIIQQELNSTKAKSGGKLWHHLRSMTMAALLDQKP